MGGMRNPTCALSHMKIPIFVPLVLLFFTPVSSAEVDRKQLVKDLEKAFWHRCLPQHISPDCKHYAHGDMFFYDITRELATEDGLLFGAVIAYDTGKPLPEEDAYQEISAEMAQKLKSHLKKEIDERDIDDLDLLREKYAITDGEKAEFDEWLLQVCRRVSGQTVQQPLTQPVARGFYCAGWLDNDTAVFFRMRDRKDDPADGLVTLVNILKKTVTLYDATALTPGWTNPKFVLWRGRTYPGVTLETKALAAPDEAKKLIEAMKAFLKDPSNW